VLKQVPIRLPEDIRAFLKEQAEKNGSSQQAEVIRALRDRMERISRRVR